MDSYYKGVNKSEGFSTINRKALLILIQIIKYRKKLMGEKNGIRNNITRPKG